MPAFRTVVVSHNARREKKRTFTNVSTWETPQKRNGSSRASGFWNLWLRMVLSRSLLAAGVGGKHKRYPQGLVTVWSVARAIGGFRRSVVSAIWSGLRQLLIEGMIVGRGGVEEDLRLIHRDCGSHVDNPFYVTEGRFKSPDQSYDSAQASILPFCCMRTPFPVDQVFVPWSLDSEYVFLNSRNPFDCFHGRYLHDTQVFTPENEHRPVLTHRLDSWMEKSLHVCPQTLKVFFLARMLILIPQRLPWPQKAYKCHPEVTAGIRFQCLVQRWVARWSLRTPAVRSRL